MALPASYARKSLLTNYSDMTSSYWGIEDDLHYRRDVTLHENHIHMTKTNIACNKACLNNLIIALAIAKKKYCYLPFARRFFDAHPADALAFITRL